MIVWEIPKMWEGGECWIIGGGPSMPRQFGVPEELIQAVAEKKQPLSAYSPFLHPIHGEHTIGINAAFLLGDWVDIVFFGDGDFYRAHKPGMDARTKLKICCSTTFPSKKGHYGLRFVGKDNRQPLGITSRSGYVSWNLNSGAASISVAHQAGVKRIYLLGFDMKLDPNGHQHWHSQYRVEGAPLNTNPGRLPFHRHLQGFQRIAQDARKLGIEILNVNPDSAITEFKKVALKDVL